MIWQVEIKLYNTAVILMHATVAFAPASNLTAPKTARIAMPFWSASVGLGSGKEEKEREIS